MKKIKPVRICDISRVLRISSASLISFLHDNGYSVIGDFRSPLSSRMMELIQNGYQEGPPFKELNQFLPQAEDWENKNREKVERLHKPPPLPQPTKIEAEEPKPRKRRRKKPKLQRRSIPSATAHTGRITLSYMDMELIQRIFELEEPEKIKVRDYFRRKTILKAISLLE